MIKCIIIISLFSTSGIPITATLSYEDVKRCEKAYEHVLVRLDINEFARLSKEKAVGEWRRVGNVKAEQGMNND